jgi:DNA polymerase V
VCEEISIYVRTNPFKDIPQYMQSHSMTLSAPTCDTRKIIKAAFTLLDEIFRPGFEYKKTAITLSKIKDANECQIALFGDNDTELDLSLMTTIDRINTREGNEMIKSMACGTNKSAWFMKQIMKSKRYVSGWTEIFRV